MRLPASEVGITSHVSRVRDVRRNKPRFVPTERIVVPLGKREGAAIGSTSSSNSIMFGARTTFAHSNQGERAMGRWISRQPRTAGRELMRHHARVYQVLRDSEHLRR